VITTASVGRTREGYEALVELAELLGIPVVEGPSADSSNFPKHHPLHQGFEGNALLKEADLVPTIELALNHFRTMGALSGEIKDLEETLEVRKLVERAKGVLMQREGLSEAEAFRQIQKTSRDERRSMKAVAQEILAAAER